MLNIEFPARRRPGVVEGAAHCNANFAGQPDAARQRVIRTAHADDTGGNGNGQRRRHALPPGERAAGQFGRVKVDAKTDAAGAAALADAHGRLTRQRQSSWPEARYFFSKGVIGWSVCHASPYTG